MLKSIKRIWYPERYHGEYKNNFIESWYFKNVGEDSTSILSIIAGIIKSSDKGKEHAFVQFNDGVTNKSHYIRFSINEFEYDPVKYQIHIGKCTFSKDRIYIDIEKNGFRSFGELNYKGQTEWVSTKMSPGTMGWYSFIPYIGYKNEVLSMNHNVRGKILINNSVYLFTFGRGYIEKSWGKFKPKTNIRLQSNNFENKDVSFYCSMSGLPLLAGNLKFFVCGLMHDDYLYKFSTYTGAKIKNVNITEDNLSFTIKDRLLHLTVSAGINQSNNFSPTESGTTFSEKIHSSLLSSVNVELTQRTRKGTRIIYQGKGDFAGLDVSGNIKKIFK